MCTGSLSVSGEAFSQMAVRKDDGRRLLKARLF